MAPLRSSRGMTDADPIALADGWRETSYDRGSYGPDDRPGVDAAFERETMTIRVLPVRYRAADGRERFRGLTDGIDESRRVPGSFVADVPERTAFAVRASYVPATRRRSGIVCVAADADDALAAAVWLTAGADDDRALQRTVDHHFGARPSATGVRVADDDALDALFATDADRCVLTGRPTRSHRVTVPYRYLPAMANCPRTPRGVVRIPSTVRSLVGAVSHGAWAEADVGSVAFGTPIERVDAGRYRLDDGALDVLANADAERFALRRLDDPD